MKPATYFWWFLQTTISVCSMLYNLNCCDLLTILPLAIYSENLLKNQTKPMQPNAKINITFKDFLQKFDPGKVWERIDKLNKLKGYNKTAVEEFKAMYKGIDETDDLLNLNIENGHPTIELQKDGRRWKPQGQWGPSYWDRHYLRPRLIELMKQAIYQARYKMTIMQTLRTKYKRNAVYKMGFLMSKTDTACKTLSSVSYKLHKDCSNVRQYVDNWMTMIDLLTGQERLLTLLFDIDLYIDLIVKNDENCRRMLQEVMTNRKYAWKFYD